uniref:ATP synthase F0 subunit 8 n=1 Tax=Vollenhovia nipponica TaxID=507702 RepID=H1A7W4_9HYME|nr:ATP synthase F0 subunit 8 [Vollenhovia nipponica]
MMPMHWLFMMIILLTFFLMTNVLLYFFTWIFTPNMNIFSKPPTIKWIWKW